MSEDFPDGCGCIAAGIIAGLLGLVLFLGPCSRIKEEPAQPKQKQGIEAVVKSETKKEEKTEQAKTYTITTKVVDVQQSTVPYSIAGGQRCTANFKYIQVQGGDIEDAVLIAPHTAQFIKKYVPVQITYQKIEKGEISLQEIVRKYYDAKADTRSETIKADGIIDGEGIEYIGEK